MRKYFVFLLIIASTVSYSQEIKLNKEETIEYIRKRILDARTPPHDETILDYQVRLEYEYFVIEIFPKESNSHVKKAKLKDSEITSKYLKASYHRMPGFGTIKNGGGYQIIIGGVKLPPLFFEDKTETERIINALKHLESFCKTDPFN